MANTKKSKDGPFPKGEQEREDFTPYKQEIILIITLLVSIFSLLSILGIGGMLGNWLRTFIFGTMGVLGYLFPFVLFFSVVLLLSNYKDKRILSRILCCIGMYFIFMGLFELFFHADSTASVTEVYLQSAESTLGGGFFGALFAVPLKAAVGVAGACLILTALLLILLTFITSRFLLSALGRKGKRKIRSIHHQYQAGQIERTVKKESYGKLPPRKRKPSITFDLREEPESMQWEADPPEQEDDVNFGQELPSFLLEPENDKTTNKKQIQQDMQEYEPVVEETEPIMQGSEEIVTQLEQSLPIAQELEETSALYRPSIRFVEPYEKQEYNRTFSAAAGSEQEQEAVTAESAEQREVFAEPTEEITRENLSDMTPVCSKQPVASERFTPEKKLDGSILENAVRTSFTEKPVPKKKKTVKETSRKTAKPEAAVSYIFPPMNLLAAPAGGKKGITQTEIRENTERLRQTFESFKVRVKFGNVSCGPAVTRYEIQPEQGVKVSKITNLADDIKLSLAAADIRIEAPIPGKAAIGIEVPNKETASVVLRELLEDEQFLKHRSKIAFAVGRDVSGQPMIADIAKMPHLLIAGATGSGKSVCINTLIMSILYKAHPHDVKLIMIDPKVVELSVYNGIPHLLIPVVTDPKKAAAALHWAVSEMTDRYGKFAELGVRDLAGYHKKVKQMGEDTQYQPLPQIVIIIDELADLMMVAPAEVEDSICRLAQMARAAGLHLVIATQRPSVNVITGVIKANVPSRIAFSVSSSVDSRTILDGVGAEKLLGKGDMLFFPSGLPKPIRVQGAFVSDTEVSRVVEFLREQNTAHTYDTGISESVVFASSEASGGELIEKDEYFAEAGKFIIEKEKASIGMLQRVYKIGFNRAARIMDQLAEVGVVGPEEGTKPRKILMTKEEFDTYLEQHL